MSRHRVVELQNLANGIPLRIAVEPSLPFAAPSQPAHDTREERQSLMTGTNPEQYEAIDRTVSRNANCTTFCIGATMCLVVLTVITMTIVMYVRVEYLINQGSAKIMPFLDASLKDVASVLDNGAIMSRHVSSMTEQGDSLLANSVPRLISMLNQTQRLMGRFEHFSSQPSINIGMG
jgi:hypothetical protein